MHDEQTFSLRRNVESIAGGVLGDCAEVQGDQGGDVGYEPGKAGGPRSRTLRERHPLVLGVEPTDHLVDLLQVES